MHQHLTIVDTHTKSHILNRKMILTQMSNTTQMMKPVFAPFYQEGQKDCQSGMTREQAKLKADNFNQGDFRISKTVKPLLTVVTAAQCCRLRDGPPHHLRNMVCILRGKQGRLKIGKIIHQTENAPQRREKRHHNAGQSGHSTFIHRCTLLINEYSALIDYVFAWNVDQRFAALFNVVVA